MASIVSNMKFHDKASTGSLVAQPLKATKSNLTRNSRLVKKVLSKRKRNLQRESRTKAAAELQTETDSVTDDELKELRLTINQRERRRMQDLNSAMDELRSVLPYNSGPSMKRQSKIATLLHARHYILFLSKVLSELASQRRNDTCHSQQQFSLCLTSIPISDYCSMKAYHEHMASAEGLRRSTDPSTTLAAVEHPHQPHTDSFTRSQAHPTCDGQRMPLSLPSGAGQLMLMDLSKPLDYSVPRTEKA